MEITIYNKNKFPIVINDSTSDRGTQKVMGTVNQGINAIDSMEFSIYPDNPGYDAITPFMTRVECVNDQDGDTEFYGRVLKANISMSASGEIYKSVICESCLGFLKDSVTPSASLGPLPMSDAIRYLLSQHVTQLGCDSFLLGAFEITDTLDIVVTLAGESLYNAVMSHYINVYGGELYIQSTEDKDADGYYKNITLAVGTPQTSISTNTIEIAENLITFSSDEDVSNLCTCAVPYGCKLYTDEDNLEYLDIKSVNNGLDYVSVESQYGTIKKTILYPEIGDAGTLKFAAENYLAKYQYPIVKYNITAFDKHLIDEADERIKVRGRYYINAPILGVDRVLLKVSKKSLCIENPANDIFSVGDEENTGSSEAGAVTISDITAVKDSISSSNAISAHSISAVDAKIDTLEAGKITAMYADIENLTANKADINLANIEDACIKTAMIDDAVITAAKIDDAAITTAKIDDAAITTAKINNAAITTAKIDDAAITEAKIEDAAITSAKIDDASITTAKIDDAAITTAKIADAAIKNANIDNATITTAKIALGAITTALIDTGAVNTAQIADGSITDAKIVGLTANKITAGTLDAGEIEVVNLNAASITVGKINGQQIANGAVSLDNLTDELASSITDTEESVAGAVADAKKAMLDSTEALSTIDVAVEDLSNLLPNSKTMEGVEIADGVLGDASGNVLTDAKGELLSVA